MRVTIVWPTESWRWSVPRSPRELALVGAEVASEREPEPADVLQGHGLVQVVLVPDLLEHDGVALLGAEGERGIARKRADTDEDEHARQEQNDQGGSDPA